MHPEVAAIPTTLEALEAGAFDVPVTPGLTALVQLVFRVPYLGSEAISKVRVSRQIMEDAPGWKQLIGRQAAEDIRTLEPRA